MNGLLALLLVVMSLGALGFQERRAGDARGAEVSFEALDIYVDSGAAVLGAYQLELKADAAQAKVVGIEGGERHRPYEQAPYYDPAAQNEDQLRERIVLAAFSTAAELPTGRTRVARIHVQVTGGAKYEAVLTAAAEREGKRIEAKVEVVPVR
jgi:hypothetical protein